MGFLSGLFGKKDGPYESYYDNGQLQSRGTYNMGELDGPGERYYENGQLQEKGPANMGVKCGEWIEDGETVIYRLASFVVDAEEGSGFMIVARLWL